MKLTGRVEHRTVELGVWVLVGDDGETYELVGGGAALRRNGQRVEVQGEVDHETMSIAMVGPRLKVTSFQVL